MTLEQLRIFVAVAEHEHMTRAAAALRITQSAVSAAIHALEARHAVALFHRVGRRIELSEAGRVLLGEARAVLARAAAAELALSELGSLSRGRLAVMASQTIASYWLPRHLVRFRRAHPGIALDVGVGNTAQVAGAVLDGTADLGFIEGPVDEPALTARRVGADRLVLVVGPDHPWAGRAGVETAELTATDWVLRESGSGTRAEFEAALLRLGIAAADLRVSLVLPSNEAVRAAVEEGAGATVVSALVVGAAVAAGTLCRVPLDLPERSFQVLHHRERYRTRAAEALLCLALSDPV